MTNSNYDSLKINFIFGISSGASSNLEVAKYFSLSHWYSDIVYVLHNVQAPPELSKTRAIYVKLKETKF